MVVVAQSATLVKVPHSPDRVELMQRDCFKLNNKNELQEMFDKVCHQLEEEFCSM